MEDDEFIDYTRDDRHWRWKLLEWVESHLLAPLGYCIYCHRWRPFGDDC